MLLDLWLHPSWQTSPATVGFSAGLVGVKWGLGGAKGDHVARPMATPVMADFTNNCGDLVGVSWE